MQQLEPRTMPRLVFLVRRFRAQIQRQRQQDDATMASLLRALRRGGPDVHQLCQLISLRGVHATLMPVARRSSDEDKDQG
jgi:hypothetical protein